ncbi:hypothetical protein MEN41_23655, partial [Dolichospermum sp. ST_con]|nr:hypothetical protein [Dolichospermum sp. ST_con]
LVISHWSLVIGHWSLVIGQWQSDSFALNYFSDKIHQGFYSRRDMSNINYNIWIVRQCNNIL